MLKCSKCGGFMLKQEDGITYICPSCGKTYKVKSGQEMQPVSTNSTKSTLNKQMYVESYRPFSLYSITCFICGMLSLVTSGIIFIPFTILFFIFGVRDCKSGKYRGTIFNTAGIIAVITYIVLLIAGMVMGIYLFNSISSVWGSGSVDNTEYNNNSYDTSWANTETVSDTQLIIDTFNHQSFEGDQVRHLVYESNAIGWELSIVINNGQTTQSYLYNQIGAGKAGFACRLNKIDSIKETRLETELASIASPYHIEPADIYQCYVCQGVPEISALYFVKE